MNLPGDPRGRELELLLERAKYERWVLAETQSLVDREFERVIDKILSPEFRNLTRFQQQRALQLFNELNRQIHSGYSGITQFHVKEMSQYATLESEIADAVVRSMISDTPASYQVGTGAFLPRHTIQSIAALPIQGLRIGEWFQAQANTMSLETRRIIQNGLVEGKGPIEISRRISADARTQGPVLSRRAINEARIVTRTTVTAVQSHAAQLSYENLPEDVSDSYRYVAVRDNRTTPICRALDGRIFRHDDPKKKIPPQHVGCRSGTIALVRDENGKLIEPAKFPHTFPSYDAWLRTQSVTEQNRILGPARADLWRSGKMTLGDAVDADNRVLNLKQLRTKLGLDKPGIAIPPKPTPPTPAKPAQLSDFVSGKTVTGVRGVKSGVHLGGIKPDALAEITKGLDAVLTPVGIKVDGLALTQARVHGLYTFGGRRQLGSATTDFIDQIAFSKKWMNGPLGANEALAQYEATRRFHIARLEKLIEQSPQRASLFQKQIEELRIPTRFTVSTTSGRPAFSTAAHEAGHAILERGGAKAEWVKAVRTIPRADRLRVSEYAAKNIDELWAEITTLRALGRSSEVPRELMQAYERILAMIGRRP